MKHFGCNLRGNDYGFKMTREKYAIVDDRTTRELRNPLYFNPDKVERNIKMAVEEALYNYDKNMEYMSSLSKEEFDKEVERFTKEFDFVEISELPPASSAPISGYYLMVLDEYKQAYIGTSENIRRRIMAHWSKRLTLERLVWGSKDYSILSIDSFQALDTTRIFILEDNDIFLSEDLYVKNFEKKFLLNRIQGGLGVVEGEEVIDIKQRPKLK